MERGRQFSAISEEEENHIVELLLEKHGRLPDYRADRDLVRSICREHDICLKAFQAIRERHERNPSRYGSTPQSTTIEPKTPEHGREARHKPSAAFSRSRRLTRDRLGDHRASSDTSVISESPISRREIIGMRGLPRPTDIDCVSISSSQQTREGEGRKPTGRSNTPNSLFTRTNDSLPDSSKVAQKDVKKDTHDLRGSSNVTLLEPARMDMLKYICERFLRGSLGNSFKLKSLEKNGLSSVANCTVEELIDVSIRRYREKNLKRMRAYAKAMRLKLEKSEKDLSDDVLRRHERRRQGVASLIRIPDLVSDTRYPDKYTVLSPNTVRARQMEELGEIEREGNLGKRYNLRSGIWKSNNISSREMELTQETAAHDNITQA